MGGQTQQSIEASVANHASIASCCSMTTSQYLRAVLNAKYWQSCTSKLYALSKNPMLLQITKYVEREIMNHRSLMHPHIVQFKEVSHA